MLVIEYSGKIKVGKDEFISILSTNRVNAMHHWQRAKVKAERAAVYATLIMVARAQQLECLPHYPQYSLLLEYNTKHDTTNVQADYKVFEDCLKKAGLITDDKPKYNRTPVHPFQYNPALPKGSWRYTLKIIE